MPSRDDLITAQECVDLMKEETGDEIAVSTFRTYVFRGQAPAAVDKFGRTPVYDRNQILDWIRNRPGTGARTDLKRARN